MSDGATQSTRALVDHLDAIEGLVHENEQAKQRFLEVNEAEHARLSEDLRVTQRALKLRLGGRLGPEELPPPKVILPPASVPVEPNRREHSAPPALGHDEYVVRRGHIGQHYSCSDRLKGEILEIVGTGPSTVTEITLASGRTRNNTSTVWQALQVLVREGKVRIVRASGTKPDIYSSF